MEAEDEGLIKICQFVSETDQGTFAEAVHFSHLGTPGLEKVAKAATPLAPELATYVKNLKPDPRYQYVLMTPMGSYEYWGMNVNGDAFPELSLAFNRDTGDWTKVATELAARWLTPHGKKLPPGTWPNFGYKTFLEADRYRHHINKDRNLSYGDIVLAMWNDAMHRVEVLVRHDWEKAKKVGAEDILHDLDAGKPRQISMGCRVPFDVCTICGNIAKTPRQYCDHLRMMMGKIMPDGRLVAAVNFFPRFFDLSDVIVPAAKESAVLMKVASRGGLMPSAFLGEALREHPRFLYTSIDSTEKTASAKQAEEKKATITKDVVSNTAVADAVTNTAKSEPDLPRDVVTGGSSLSRLLATLSALGVVLKKSEFQRAALEKMGCAEEADILEKNNLVFRSSSTPLGYLSFALQDFDAGLAEKVATTLPERSGFYPHLPARMLRKASAVSAPAEVGKNNELLEKVAGAYLSYRQALPRSGDFLAAVVDQNLPFYADHFLDEVVAHGFNKVAGVLEFTASEPITSLYINGAHGVTVEPATDPRYLGMTSTRTPARSLLGPSPS